MFSLIANRFPKALSDIGRRLASFSLIESSFAADPFQVRAALHDLRKRLTQAPDGYERVFLSDAADRDPVLLDLPEKLIHHKIQLDPEGYGFIKTIGEKCKVSPETINVIQKRYSEMIPASRCFISYEDQFPGLRRLVIFGPAYSQSPGDDGTRDYTVIGVTEQGRLFDRMVTMPEGKHSVGSILDTIRNRWLDLHPAFPSTGYDFDVNMHSSGWRSSSLNAASHIFLRTCEPSMRVKDTQNSKFQNIFIQVTRMRLEKDMRLARHAICSALDPEILRTMRANYMTRVSDAAWLSGQKPIARPSDYDGNDRWFGFAPGDLFDPGNSKSRVQAVNSYPLLSSLLKDRLTHAIDCQKPLAKAIEHQFELDERTVRHLSGLTWQRSGFPKKGVLSSIRLLQDIPVDLLPQRKSDYRQLENIRSFSGLYGGVENAFRIFSKGGSPYRFGDQLRPAMDATDAMFYVVQKLIIPMRFHAIKRLCDEKDMEINFSRGQLNKISEYVLTARKILSSMGPKDIFEMSDRWHRSLHRHDAALVTLTSRRVWNPMVGDIALPKGIILRELVSADALKRQGREQGHCVGGYDGKVINSQKNAITLIFSIEKAGQVIGTAEVLGKPNASLRDGADGPAYVFSVVQNRSVRNSDPTPEAKSSANILISHLEALTAEQIQSYLTDINLLRSREKFYNGLPTYISNAGFDIWEPGALEAAWNELSVYLPRSMRRAGLERGIANMDMEGLRFTIRNPDDHGKPFWEKDSGLVKSMSIGDIEEASPKVDYENAWM